MKKRKIALIGLLLIIFAFLWLFNTLESTANQEQLAKIALREVGHELLLSNQDSSSVVPPIVALEDARFKLEFKEDISIVPGDLVELIHQRTQNANLPDYYVVEVIQCLDGEVAYSYQMEFNKDTSIIPCGTRALSKSCYNIQVDFMALTAVKSKNPAYLYAFLGVLVFLFLDYLVHARQRKSAMQIIQPEHAPLGVFKFYPEQNKLVREAVEINLSAKECELLALFTQNPNQIIKREELTKKVWEDKGVFVGRSLDTYISKLRKKLKDDDSIKITNVHGVGYKLEIL